jgi:hypothetical protein
VQSWPRRLRSSFVAIRASRAKLLPDLQEARGYVAAAAADMAAAVTGSLSTALGVLSGALRAFPGGLLAPVAAGLEVVTSLAAGAFSVLHEAGMRLAGGVGTVLRGVLTAAAGAVTLAGTLGAGAVLGLARGVIAAATPAADAVSSLLGGAARIVVGTTLGVGTALLGLGALMLPPFQLAASMLGSTLGPAVARTGESVGSLLSALQSAGQSVLAVAGTLAAPVVAGIQSVLGRVGGLLTGAGGLISSGLQAAFRGVVGAMPDWLLRGAGAVAGAATTLAGYVATGVRASAALFARALPVVSATVTAGFQAIGQGLTYVAAGLAGGLRSVVSGLGSAVSAAVSLVGGLFSGLMSFGTIIFGALVSVVSGLATAVSGALSAVTGVLGTVAGAAGEFLGSAFGVAAGAATRAIELLASTVGAVLSPALSALSADLTDWAAWTAGAMQAETVAVRLATLIHAQGEAAGWSAAQLDVMARSMADMGTNSLGQIREAQLTLARFGNVRGFQFSGALEGARQLSALLGTELPAAAQMLGRALESPEHGMTALRRAGVILSENERHMVQWAARSGDVVGAQNVILGKLAQLGDVSGAVSETTAGHVNRLKLTWESVGVAIGKAVMPFATIIVDFLQPIIGGFAETMKAFFGGVADSGQGLLASARGWIAENQGLLTGWGRMLGRTVADLITFVGGAFAQLGRLIMAVWKSVGDSGEDSSATVMDAVTGLLATVRALAGDMTLTWNIATTGFKIAWQETIDWLQARWNTFDAWFAGKLMGMSESLVNIPSHLPGWAGSLFAPLTSQVNAIIEKQKAALKAAAAEAAKAPPVVNQELVGLREQLGRLTGELQQRVAEAREEAARPPGRMVEQRRRDQGLDMTPTPAAIEDVQVKFGMAGFSDMWRNIQRSITGTSPEALARANINAINGVKGSVDGVGGKVDNLLNWFRNNRNQGGFGP